MKYIVDFSDWLIIILKLFYSKSTVLFALAWVCNRSIQTKALIFLQIRIIHFITFFNIEIRYHFKIVLQYFLFGWIRTETTSVNILGCSGSWREDDSWLMYRLIKIAFIKDSPHSYPNRFQIILLIKNPQQRLSSLSNEIT